MTPRPRSIKDLERLESYKEAREIVLIVCEGRKTEPNYFTSLRNERKLSSVEVEICGDKCGSAPISVVNCALQKKEEVSISPVQLPYDSIWCVCDVEAPKRHESLFRARDKARSNNINFILTNPCFEYWYLLHFKKVSRFMNNSEVKKILKKKENLPNYKKNDPKTFNEVYPRTKAAIKNSRIIIREKGWGKDLIECNPSTHVHLLVEYLFKIAKIPR